MNPAALTIAQLNTFVSSGTRFDALSTDLAVKVNTTSIADKSLDGNFKTLKVMDTDVVTDISGKLSSSAVADKSLDGNFKTLKVMDTAVVTDISGKLNTSGGTISSNTSPQLTDTI
jgi:hypothetical protein